MDLIKNEENNKKIEEIDENKVKNDDKKPNIKKQFISFVFFFF
jgi:hypothetical protein